MSADRVRAYIALGANLGDSAATLRRCWTNCARRPASPP